MFIQVSLIKYGKQFLSLHLAGHSNLEETKCIYLYTINLFGEGVLCIDIKTSVLLKQFATSKIMFKFKTKLRIIITKNSLIIRRRILIIYV
jgi:hypothetical protein